MKKKLYEVFERYLNSRIQLTAEQAARIQSMAVVKKLRNADIKAKWVAAYSN